MITICHRRSTALARSGALVIGRVDVGTLTLQYVPLSRWLVVAAMRV
jgi:hypothetical protein